jgi:hypothetical protein
LPHEIKILFYILIGIGYLFVKMYSKLLKNQNEKQINKRPVGKKPIETIFKDLQKSLNLPSDNVKEPVKVAPKSAKNKQDKDHSRYSQGTSKMQYYKPIKASKLKKESSLMELEEIAEEETANKANILSNFDPKMAVIYSEILKRPQY